MCSSFSWFILLKFSLNQNKPKPPTTRFSLILRFSLPTNHHSHRATHHSQVRRRDLSPAPPLLLDDSTSIPILGQIFLTASLVFWLVCGLWWVAGFVGCCSQGFGLQWVASGWVCGLRWVAGFLGGCGWVCGL